THVLASDIAPQPDNGLSAHNLRTGEVVWSNDDVELGNTALVLREDGLEVTEVRGGDETVSGFDPATGERLKKVPKGTVVTTSAARWPPAPVMLDNGWQLSGFRPGYDTALEFRDASDIVVWTLELGDYMYAVAAIDDTLYVAKDYLTDEAVVRA